MGNRLEWIALGNSNFIPRTVHMTCDMLYVAQGELLTTRGKVTAGLGGAGSQRLSQTTMRQVRGRSQNYRLSSEIPYPAR